MGFEPIGSGGGPTKKALDIPVGGELVAYMVGVKETQGKFGEQTNLVMQDPESGEQFMLYTAGTLAYAAKDGRIKAGLLTKIVRKGDERRKAKNNSSYTTSVFEVLQDPSTRIEVASSAATALPNGNSAASITERAQAIKDKQLGRATK